MGSDDFSKKHKVAKNIKLARAQPSRQEYDKVLIVCEGSKTEPLYFKWLVNRYKLSTAQVQITGCGSDPLRVAEHGQTLYEKEIKSGKGAFDRVYCVVDKDTHATYAKAIAWCESARPQGVYRMIFSVPCFEYWFLLHYQDSCKPYVGKANRSVGEAVCDDLKKHYPSYNKAQPKIFTDIFEHIETAKSRAQQGLAAVDACGTDNPSTRVHELVAYLQTLQYPQKI